MITYTQKQRRRDIRQTIERAATAQGTDAPRISAATIATQNNMSQRQAFRYLRGMKFDGQIVVTDNRGYDAELNRKPARRKLIRGKAQIDQRKYNRYQMKLRKYRAYNDTFTPFTETLRAKRGPVQTPVAPEKPFAFDEAQAKAAWEAIKAEHAKKPFLTFEDCLNRYLVRFNDLRTLQKQMIETAIRTYDTHVILLSPTDNKTLEAPREGALSKVNSTCVDGKKRE